MDANFFNPKAEFRGSLDGLLIYAAIWRNPNLKRDEKILLAIVASYFNEALGYAFPSMVRLVKESEFSKRYIQDTLKRLEDIGMIHVERGSGHSHSQYRFRRGPI